MSPFGLVLTSLPHDGEVPGSIPGCAVGLFSKLESFHVMYGLGFSVFHCPFSMDCALFYSDEGLLLCPCSYMWSRKLPNLSTSRQVV